MSKYKKDNLVIIDNNQVIFFALKPTNRSFYCAQKKTMTIFYF